MDSLPPTNVISAEQVPGNPLVQEVKPAPAAIVIFGITGDLAKRKLIPALYNLLVDGAMPDRFAILGLPRGTESHDEMRDKFRADVKEFGRRKSVDPDVWKRFGAALEFVNGKLDDPK